MADQLLDELRKLGRTYKRVPCKIALALDVVPADKRESVESALASDEAVLRRGALKWLERESGMALAPSVLGCHRTGKCRCHE